MLNEILRPESARSEGRGLAILRGLIATIGGMRGICALLGQRETTGTVNRPRAVLKFQDIDYFLEIGGE